MQRNTQRNTQISKTNYSFFQPSESETPEHTLNWYVYRNNVIRGEMIRLWNNGKGINDKKELSDANADQKKCQAINILFRNMENHGPYRSEFNNFKPDTKNDMFHCHVSESKPSYVVMWEADFERKIINIVAMGPHENFNFDRRHKKKDVMPAIEQVRDRDNKYLTHLEHQAARHGM